MSNVIFIFIDPQLRRSIVPNAGNAKTALAVVLAQCFMKWIGRNSSREDARIGHEMENLII